MLLVGFMFVAACTSGKLPGYARPSVSFVTTEEMDLSDVIGYRQLRRSDFRGEKPPSNFDDRMAAVTCVYTRPQVDKDGIEISPLTGEDGERIYEVTYNNLSYRALMNRNCSWWNPNTSGFEEKYVLEHEQIHFALFEAAAREWSRQPPLRLRVKSDSRNAMRREVEKQFEAVMQARLAILRAENLRFDEDTSLGHNPVKQKEWLRSVMSRLQNTEGFAAGNSGSGCRIEKSTRELIERTRVAMASAAEAASIGRLLDEAETAAGPPECDSVRARILADKAVELVSD